MKNAPIVTRSRAEKAAADNGYDLDLSPVGEWSGYASSMRNAQVWYAYRDGQLFVSFDGPHGGVAVESFAALHRQVRAAWLAAR